MKTKRCPHCQLTKSVDEFSKRNKQFSTLSSWCKKCTSNKINENYHYRTKVKDVDDFPVYNEPNLYYNEEQRNQVFEFLNTIGWSYNDDRQIWFKDGIKDRNGIWNFEK